MKNKLFKIFSVVAIVTILVSLLVIPSSAARVPEASSEGYMADIQSGYYLFNPNSGLVKDYPLASTYKFEFFVGDNYSVRFDTVVSVALEPDVNYSDVWFVNNSVSPSNSVRICRCFENDSLTWYNEQYKLLYVPAQTVDSDVLNFLGIFCIKAADPGWYEFNYMSPLLGSFEFNLPLFTSNSPGVVDIPSVIYGRIERNTVTLGEVPDIPSFVLYFDEISSEGRRFSTSGGFSSDLPGTTIWDGRLYFEFPEYFSSAEQFYWFTVLFTPSWYLADPNASYDEGYSAGFDLGFDTGKGAGLSEGFQQGKDTWYPIGLREGEDIGYDKGFNASATENFGKNLLGETLTSPWKALMDITLFDLPGGNPFTLGTLFGTLVSLTLLLIFLKMFAGG